LRFAARPARLGFPPITYRRDPLRFFPSRGSLRIEQESGPCDRQDRLPPDLTYAFPPSGSPHQEYTLAPGPRIVGLFFRQPLSSPRRETNWRLIVVPPTCPTPAWTILTYDAPPSRTLGTQALASTQMCRPYCYPFSRGQVYKRPHDAKKVRDPDGTAPLVFRG